MKKYKSNDVKIGEKDRITISTTDCLNNKPLPFLWIQVKDPHGIGTIHTKSDLRKLQKMIECLLK